MMSLHCLRHPKGRAKAAGMDIRVKICGLRQPADVAAAAEAGAAYVGFVFFERSPRNVTLAEARALALQVPPGIAKVALTVDATDTALDAIVAEVPLDMLQLHGRESPERVSAVRARHDAARRLTRTFALGYPVEVVDRKPGGARGGAVAGIVATTLERERPGSAGDCRRNTPRTGRPA